ncbi:aspartic peptidase domain-containing protein [Podospora conica]|nr:aspartic peptidase domain-containing protein [Schizothecium conicum]
MAFLLLLATLFLTLASASPFPPSGGPGKFSVKAKRNEHYNPNGPAQYAKALTKWGGKVPKGLARYVANKGQVSSVEAVPFRDDREYISSVGFGTPPQYLPVDLDTGSADVWIYSSETRLDDLGNHTRWTPENSTTAVPINASTWSIQYGDQSYAYGTAWKETITLGGLTIPDAVVESALDVSPSLAEDPMLGGIFGLAPGLGSEVIPSHPTVLDTLLPLLERPLFTADLRYHAHSTYTFGHIDPAAHKGAIHYIPLVPGAEFWEINYNGFNVGSDTNWFLSRWDAIVDTGTSLLLLQDDIVRLYYAQIPQARYNASWGIWEFPCATTRRLPDFKMGFGKWHTAVPGRYMNYTVLDPAAGTCMGGLQSSMGSSFGIIGDIFLKAVFVVFDVAGKRVGFADKAAVHK